MSPNSSCNLTPRYRRHRLKRMPSRLFGRRHTTISPEAGIAFGLTLLTTALGALSAPRWLWFITLAIAVVLLAVALAGTKTVQQRWPRLGRLPFVVDRKLGRQLVGPPPKPQQAKRGPLCGPERDDLRKLIAHGEQLEAADTLEAEPVLQWIERSASWLQEHRQERSTRNLRRWASEPGAKADLLIGACLKELRTVLIQNIPAGISLDMTPGEALDRWMEVENIPEDKRPDLRTMHQELERKLDFRCDFSGGYSASESRIEFGVKLTNDSSKIVRDVVVRGYLDDELVTQGDPVDVPVQASPVVVNIPLKRPKDAELAPELNHRPVFHGRRLVATADFNGTTIRAEWPTV